MKKLGLIGGTGPESTVPYYRGIVYGVQERLGRKQFPPLTIESIDVFQVLDLCAKEDYDGLTAYLLDAVEHLSAAGAQFAALTGNTPHIVFDRLQAAAPIPLVSMVEASGRAAKAMGYRRLGLLGTAFTMEGAFFKEPFLVNGIDIVIPDERERAYINKKISNELELGVVKEETLLHFQAIIRRMREEQRIDGVLLGCTELPLLLNDAVSPVPCLDTMKVHIERLVDLILDQ